MRPRTIILTAGGLLVAGMLVFLAIEVSRDSSASGGGDGKASGGASAAHRSAAGVSAQRSQPLPRPGRGGDRGDEADSAGEENSAGGAAVERTPPPKVFPRVPVPAVGPAAGLSEMPAGPTTSNTDPEQDEKTAAATEAYDKGDYQTAHERALAVLETSPRNLKALRIAVSTSCMFGEMDRARELNARLPRAQQEKMRKRCKKNGGDL